MIVTHEMLTRIEIKQIKTTSSDENFDVPIENDVRTPSNCNNGQALSSTIECTSGQTKHYTFEMLMQHVSLIYNYGTNEVSNWDRKKLPCLLREGVCETTTLDSFAYTWDTPKNCVMTKILTQDARMLHYPLTTDQKESQFFSKLIQRHWKRNECKTKSFP